MSQPDRRPAAFDLKAFTRAPRDLRGEGLGIDAAVNLPAEALHTIAYLADVERDSIALLRNVLVTPTHAEAEVTAFLTTWAYEQYWLAAALDAVLAANGHEHVALRPGLGARLRRLFDDRLRPTVDAIRTNLLGEDIVAGHMVTGLLDVEISRLAYARLAALEPACAPLAAAIERTKERHAHFYAEQARARLAGSPGARALARSALRAWMWPGARYGQHASAARTLRYLLADPAARAGVAAIEAGLARLPGLANTGVLRAELGRFAPGRAAWGRVRVQ